MTPKQHQALHNYYRQHFLWSCAQNAGQGIGPALIAREGLAAAWEDLIRAAEPTEGELRTDAVKRVYPELYE